MAVDSRGATVYITTGDDLVKAPAGGGAQTTVGMGLRGPRGVAVDSAGAVYIADTGHNRVVKVPAGGLDPVELRIRNEPAGATETGHTFSSRGSSRASRKARRFGWNERGRVDQEADYTVLIAASVIRTGAWTVLTQSTRETRPATMLSGRGSPPGARRLAARASRSGRALHCWSRGPASPGDADSRG